ncbi:unnamed protein product [Parajaminaea phylloscopi]
MMPWWGSRVAPHTLRCFFCNHTSIILADDAAAAAAAQSLPPPPASQPAAVSHGNPSIWTCCHCTARNIHDPDAPHGMSSWDPAMDSPGPGPRSPATTPRRHELLRSSTASLSPGTESSGILCSRCLANLRIQTALLAEIDVTEATSEEIDDRKRLLHARYPILCKQCRPAVDAKIESRNKEAQREVWKSQMDARRRVVGRAIRGVSNNGAGVGEATSPTSPTGLLERYAVIAARLQLVVGSMLGVCVLCGLTGVPPAARRPFVLALYTLLAHWVFHLLFTERIVKPAVEERREDERDEILDSPRRTDCLQPLPTLPTLPGPYWSPCVHAIAARLCLDEGPWSSAMRTVSAATLVVQAASLATLAPRTPRPVGARGGGGGGGGGGDKDGVDTDDDPDEPVALVSDRTGSIALEHFNASTALQAPVFGSQIHHPQSAPLSEAGVDRMDWQPSPCCDDAMAVDADPARQWTTQRFYAPEEATGLETLLSRRLVLTDEDTNEAGRGVGASEPRRRWLWTPGRGLAWAAWVALTGLAVALAVTEVPWAHRILWLPV